MSGQAIVKEKLWTPSLILSFVGTFMLFSSFQLLVPILPLYLMETFGADKVTVGWGIAIYIITAMFIRPFAGFLVDYFARKPLLVLCYIAVTIFFGLYMLATTLMLFILVRALHGLAFGLVTVSNSTMAIDLMPASRRTEGIGLYGISSNLAMAFGPMIALFLLEKTGNYTLIFLCSLIASGIGLACASCIRSEHRPSKISRPISLDRFFLIKGTPVALNTSLFSFANGMVCTYLVLYGSQEVGIKNGTGLYFLLMSVSLVLIRLFTTRQMRPENLRMNVISGIILLLIGLVLFTYVKEVHSFYASACFIGAAYGIASPCLMNMFLDLGHHDQRGTANSSYLISWDIGVGAGILAGGKIAEHSSFTTAYTVSIVLAVAALAMFSFLTYRYFEKNRLRR